ncbi:MAG: peptidylprolyl isomerase [Fidelibacterota bacterium]
MNIQDNSVVTIHYTLTDDQGTQLDSSENHGPLNYLHGAHNIIPGLENALTGKKVGDSLEVEVSPKDGYGLVDPAKIQDIPLSAFDGVETVKPGMQFQAQDSSGNVQNITVNDVKDDIVTVDANHPLAGKVLHFAVTIENIRHATPEEISHGHIH